MKVLFTNALYGGLTGSEISVYQLAREFQKRGWIVYVWSPYVYGALGGSFNPTDKLAQIPECDLGIISHQRCKDALKHVRTSINVCHGVIPPEEKPLEDADFYVGLSEEITEASKYPFYLIRPWLDLSLYKSSGPVNQPIEKVLFIGRYSGGDIPRVACEQLGLEFWHVTHEPNIPAAINWADLVIGMGRAVYESLACERPVICFEDRPYQKDEHNGDGLITSTSVFTARHCNCSGRALKIRFDVDGLVAEIRKARAATALPQWGRKYAEGHHDVVKAVDSFLGIYNEDDKQKSSDKNEE